MFTKHLLATILFLIITTHLVPGQNRGFLIDPDKLLIDANDAPYNEVKPGDTLYFVAGNRNYLLIRNFQGQPGKPIVMINSDGEVIIDTDHYYGISILNCRYFKFTGTGDSKQIYGFKIKRVASGAGMGIGDLSSDFEIDHISVENTMIGGIYAKTDPDCSTNSVRGKFTQYNTMIHDNYIANTGNEGLYVGNSNYFGQNAQCNGNDTLLMPGLLEGVRIYNNIIKYSGWDGIQVSSSPKNCQIYGNTILFDSQQEAEFQMSGIIIGGGSKCDCFNNYIGGGKGDGIESHGLGGYRIFNNIIVDAGQNFKPDDKTVMKHGIFVSDISVQKDSSFYIMHNNIINPKSEGIRFSSVKSKGSYISSNVIVNPGNYDYYENGNTSFKGIDSYVMFQNSATDATLKNNYLTRNGAAAGFSSQTMQSASDFQLVGSSPLINAADMNAKVVVSFDFLNHPRPYAAKSDIGAFEYESTTSSDELKTDTLNRQSWLLQNPVTDILKIGLRPELDDDVILEIISVKGVVIPKQMEIKAGTHLIEANVESLTSGIYFYLIRTKKYTTSGKFIKL